MTRAASISQEKEDGRANKGSKRSPPSLSPQQESNKKPRRNPNRNPNRETDKIVCLFRAKHIPVYLPQDEMYEKTIVVPNLHFRYRRPRLVVRPTNTSQVEYIVQKAKLLGIPITVKVTGHSYSGSSTTNKGILLSLGDMTKTSLDVENMISTMEGGATWGHAYANLYRGGHKGFVINGGRCPNVGVAGFLLGGGIGPFTRQFGMGCDSLLEMTIVTAKGKAVTVKVTDDTDSDKGKMFWALQGAGHGNFGVVTGVKVAVHKLQSQGGFMVSGLLTWYPKGKDYDGLLSTMSSLYLADWSEKLTIDSSWTCEMGKDKMNKIGVRFTTYYDGTLEAYTQEVESNIPNRTLTEKLIEKSIYQPTTQWLHAGLEQQQKDETIKFDPKKGKSHSIYTSFVFTNKVPGIIEIVTAIVKEQLEAFKEKWEDTDSAITATFSMIHTGGQASKVHGSGTAFWWRNADFHGYFYIQYENLYEEKAVNEFFRTFRSKMLPLSTAGGSFANFPDKLIRVDEAERAYFGKNREELRRVKAIWDKDDFFGQGGGEQGVQLPKDYLVSPPILRDTDPGARGTDNAISEQEEADRTLQEFEEAEFPDNGDYGGMWYYAAIRTAAATFLRISCP
ncbi:hypothetical protein VTL71DRAFT_10879 [Oculimacula yallundae]|uniref:FAD-binding PCMH-type domain-containing protein n=1 Tax=Oculimacula yallundae TaxID=86028 RepID=A0ABR4CW19_9HELO